MMFSQRFEYSTGKHRGKKLRSPLAEALVSGVVRRNSDKRVIFHQEDGLRGPMRWLRDGGLMAFLHDQDISRIAGVHVPWFNILAYTPSGPASLAVSTRSAMQSVCIVWEHGRWVMYLGPRHYPRRTRDRDGEVVRMTSLITG